jgi:hypothetical protein
VFSLNSFLKISLVSVQDFVVSFVHLECAPFGCSSNIQVPITINNDAHSRFVSPFLEKNYAGLGISLVAAGPHRVHLPNLRTKGAMDFLLFLARKIRENERLKAGRGGS